jgi:tRNA threonylcarbamoyladenosine biosynthesis protein TsaE
MSAGIERRIKNLDEMREFAMKISNYLAQANLSRVLILLQGPMGAGKTQWTRYFLEAMGSSETASPSFAIHHRYPIPQSERTLGNQVGQVDHFDLFRLKSEDDLESTGFWDLFLESKGIVLVEWADRLADLGLEKQLPRAWSQMKITITSVPDGSDERDVTIQTEMDIDFEIDR